MKIGLFGDGQWAQLLLEKLVADTKFSVAYVVLRYGKLDEKLRSQAEQYDIPCFSVKNVNEKMFLEQIKDFSVDINVSMSFDQILKQEIIGLAPLSFINCHAGALPFYRGRNILNWAIINGEEKFGVTVHYVDESIDTGDIILQRFADIKLTDDYGSVLPKAWHLCAEVLYDALVLLREGTAKRTPQKSIHPVGFYCSARSFGDEYIDWNWSSMRIFNFVRGIAHPAPGARTFLNGKEAIIAKAELIDNAPIYIDKPGTVVGKDSAGIVIKTGDSTIRLLRFLDAADGKDIAPTCIRIGMRLGDRDRNGGMINLKRVSTPPLPRKTYGLVDWAKINQSHRLLSFPFIGSYRSIEVSVANS